MEFLDLFNTIFSVFTSDWRFILFGIVMIFVINFLNDVNLALRPAHFVPFLGGSLISAIITITSVYFLGIFSISTQLVSILMLVVISLVAFGIIYPSFRWLIRYST